MLFRDEKATMRDNKKTKEEVVNDLLFLGFDDEDVYDIYKLFFMKYKTSKVLEGTRTIRKYERQKQGE